MMSKMELMEENTALKIENYRLNQTIRSLSISAIDYIIVQRPILAVFSFKSRFIITLREPFEDILKDKNVYFVDPDELGMEKAINLMHMVERSSDGIRKHLNDDILARLVQEINLVKRD